MITVPDLAKLAIEKPRIESDASEIADALGRIADENRPTVALAKPCGRIRRRDDNRFCWTH